MHSKIYLIDGEGGGKGLARGSGGGRRRQRPADDSCSREARPTRLATTNYKDGATPRTAKKKHAHRGKKHAALAKKTISHTAEKTRNSCKKNAPLSRPTSPEAAAGEDDGRRRPAGDSCSCRRPGQRAKPLKEHHATDFSAENHVLPF